VAAGGEDGEPGGDQLSPEELAVLTRAVERIARRRKIQLIGYTLALLVMIVGMLASLYVYGVSPPGRFVGWVFFIPFGLVGLILWLFGKWSKRA
jgi:hypothetical protein